MKIFKSLLFIPGNKENMLEKALSLKPSAYIPDLEDSVTESEKINALNCILKYLPMLISSGVPVIPRVNNIQSEFIEYEIQELTKFNIYGISIGKIRNPEDLAQLIKLLEKYKKDEVNQIKIIPWLESAEAITRAPNILHMSPNIIAAAFGGEDFAQDLGVKRSDDENDLSYARQSIAIAARANGIYALDTPYFNFKDDQGLIKNIEYVKQLGFKGKFAIHPNQIDIINNHFRPSTEEVENAKEVIRHFESAAKEGRGSTSLNNKVIDIPVYKRALDIVGASD
jgi:citrate lyase subunit beta/citryl-CoA lyase